MFQRSLIPALLAGVLAVGCSTAQAQERDDAPGPAVQDGADPRMDRARRDREAALEALRPELQRALERLTRGETRLKDSAIDAAGLRLKVVQQELDILKKSSDLEDAMRDVARELEIATEEDGLGDRHRRVLELHEKLSALERHRVLITERADKYRAQLNEHEAELHAMESSVAKARHDVEALRRRLVATERHAPLPRPTGDRRGREHRAGAPGPGRGAPHGPRGADDRIARLERTVAELAAMLEHHGFPEARRRRAQDEMERRQREPRGRPESGPRRARAPRPGPGERGSGERGSVGGGRGEVGGPGPSWRPRGGPDTRGERRPPPPDTGAVRAETDELRRELERARHENAELRERMERMHREMEELREGFEYKRRRGEDREDR